MKKETIRTTAIAFFTALAIIYLGVFLYLALFTGIYDISAAHNDRFFSADDVYFVSSFFSSTPEPSTRVIKHPLLCLFGWLFTLAESKIFRSGISAAHHYELIVLFQMLMSWLSSLYLFKTISEHQGVEPQLALGATAVYSFAFSTVFYTFIAESFIFSSLALIMTYYFARKGDFLTTALLGAACAGITITNAAAWVIIVLFTMDGEIWKRLGVLLAGAMIFCVAVYLSPFRDTFFQNVISGGLNSANSYSDHFGPVELAVRVFYAFFGSTMFYIDTAKVSPFGEFSDDALSFVPSSPQHLIYICALWLLLLIVAAVTVRKDRFVLAPIAVIAFNLVLHGIIQYGLKEGFLYSLHHLSSQILLVSFLISKKLGVARYAVFTVLLAYAAAEIVLNFPGYMEILSFVR